VKNCNVSSSIIPRGISLSYCNAITILDSICEASSALNTTSGIYLEYSDNNDLISNTCSGKPSPWLAPDVSIRLISSDSNTIKSNTCWKSDIAIELVSSNNNDIIANIIEGSGDIGINLSNSNGNLIDKHEISKFEIGISLYNSGKEKKNVITWNILNDNKKYGMKLENTEENEIRHNTFSFNGKYGISVYYSTYDDIQRNNICGNLLNELIATNSIGHYPACWWGVKIDCITKIIEIESSISIYPWVTDGEGPPWKHRTLPALYLHRIHELFPILRLLMQRLGLQ
jgi:parallel beta-helix repeat protein